MTQQIDIVANLLMKVDGAEAGLKKLQGSLSGLKLPKGLDTDLKKSMSNLEGLFATYRKQIEKGFETKSDVSAFTKTAKSVNAEYDRITRTLDKLNNTNVTFNIKSDSIKKVEQDLDNIIKKRDQLSTDTQKSIAVDLANIQKAGSRSTKVQDYSNMLGVAIDKGQWQEALRLAQLLKTQFEGLSDKTKQAFATMSNGKSATAALDDIVAACRKGGEGFDKLEKEGKEAAELLASLQAKDLEQIEKALAKMGGEWQESTNGAKALNGEMTELARSTQSMSQQLGDLQQSTQYFFSLRNMINLLKRGISDAVQTVKELDKAMTETAVVTDFSVGDMWAKLPEYTANANKLGATIQDMYESTTLYYQQGLNTQQSMAIATETMKMARIAGLEAKDATDMMTAALRGFNMELNETSAERINDVYSNLAAKTASDTEEIGKAMQRTASIAHSAGMSFEGTAAFLAQAVETTREPAENIGTAMKTIVARFQEMKKNPLEITEVDGEEVSYNKVDAALQSIGVSLKDTNGQFRELDKVFLDISKRWDSLSQTQQRYIATIAAGSRQQSRFIAMMGDYDRTVELMSYANDSAGASQEQFNKTLDSLEAKINKFQNAWDQFLMGIMNDSWVKGLVDAGTTILKTVNGIIDALSFGGKAKGLKSLLSIGTAGVALKAGGNLINKLIGGVGGFIDPASSFGKGFWGAGKTTQEGTPATGMAGKITTPIVAKLNELIAVTRKANNLKDTNTQVTSTLGQYKNVSAMLRNPGSLNMGDIRSLFSGLSDEHAYMAYKNTPGTVDAMKQAALGWLGSTKMPTDAQKTGQQLMSAIFKGMSKKEISIKDGMKLMGKPALWGEYFGTDVAKGFSQRYVEQFKSQVPEMKQKTQQAVEQTWQQLLGDNANNKAMQQGFLASQVGKDKFNTAYKNNRLSLGLDKDLKDIPIAQTNLQKFANTVGNFGSRMGAAGMSIQQFGIQLGQMSPALEGVGSVLVRIGGALSTFGMGLSGVGDIATKAFGRISLAVTAVKSAQGLTLGSKAGLFGSILTAGLSPVALGAIAATAVVGGILIAKNIADKKAREAGEEIRKNFEQGFTETNKKIDSISDYKDRFNELSKGVDQFGHNINLTDEEFDEYLTISRELQELSPSLISGYNAEGQAILRKGAALDEVIDKLKEERDLSLQDYITDDSIGKLIGEYNTSDAYKNHNTIRMGDSGMGDAFEAEKSSISKAIKEAELEWSDFSQILDELGIGGAESINDLTNQQLSMITAHYTDIVNKIKEFNPQIEEEAEEGLKEAFAETNNALEDVLTEGAPIVDALRQWMGQEKLDAVGLGLSEEFVSGFNSGLDGLMLEGLTNNWKPEEYKAQLRDYANEWEHLAGPTSTYSTILAEADEIQQQYLDHIGEDSAIQNYENDVEGLANQLELLAEQYKGTGAAGEIFAEQCQQQANNLRNYATEGVLTLGEALNTLSDEFASARGAQERFQKATEGGDYYTAAEGYKSIIDTMLDEKNTAGNGSDGSLTFWAGADELLGQKFVDSHTADEVVKQVEKIKDCFEDGLPGVQKFGDLLVENADKLEGLGKINEETGQFEFDFKNLDDLEKYAELLDMSEDALAALIDKSRQWVPWNLSDPGMIRKAIEDSQYSMAGVSTKGENLVYTSESQFRAEARQQGVRGDDYTKTKSDAEERGVRFLNVENLTAKNGEYANQVLDNIGLKGADKTLDNAVAALTKMGFSLEDQQDILTSKGIKLADGEVTGEQIAESYNEQAYKMENPTVAGIASDASTLVSNTSAMLAAMGILTEDAKKEIDQATNEDTTQGYIDNLQNASSVNERNTARTTMEDRVSEYNALANKLVEAGRSETDPYVQKLRGAAEALQTELDAEAKNWNDKAVAANQYLKNNNIIPQEATAEEQQAIQLHAVDIQSAIETGDAQVVLETLKQIETEGNLSIETMIGLGQSISNLGAVDSSTILHFISEYYEKLKLAKQESDQPFEIETKFTGEKLEDHISKVKEFTTQEYAFLVRADVTGEEKVSTLINSINQEFGKGDEETKTILIDAVAKTANGDKEGAHNILAETFGKDTAETIEKKIDILCDGSVANKGEVKKALEGELEQTIVEPKIKAKAQVSIDNINTNKKIKPQQGKINYTTGDVAPVAAQTTKLNYTTGDIPHVPAQRTDLNFNIGDIPSIPDQEVNIYPKLKGSGTYTVIANARGRNYSIPARSSLSFGSAAQGMNLPKKKKSGGSQVTALVGEEGFEVGYIPSEQRSVIFGAGGPEMTSFPKDTIIYPHDKSLEILRRGKNNHQSVNSFAGGNSGSSGGIPTTGSRGGSSSSSSSRSSSTNKKVQTAAKAVTQAATTVSSQAGFISTYWENAAHRVDVLQKKIDKSLDNIDKKFKTFGTTLNSMKGTIASYKTNLKTSITINENLRKRAQDELGILAFGRASKTFKDVNVRYDKKEISYETKNAKGKTTTTKKVVSLAPYIRFNKDYDTYELNTAELKKVAKTNISMAKALKEAAESALSDRKSKLKTAEDAIKKAQEALEKVSNDVYQTFYAWEKSINRVYLLSQKLEILNAKLTTSNAKLDLQFSKMEAGTTRASTGLSKVTAALKNQSNLLRTKANASYENLSAKQTDYQKSLTLTPYLNNYVNNKDSTDAKNQYLAAFKALKFLDQANLGGNKFDYNKAISYLNSQQMTKNEYEAIKSVLDGIFEKQNAFLDAQSEAYQSIDEIYQAMEEYQSFIVEFENNLLSGIEEQAEDQIQRLDKLNSSLTKAYKDLLDEVKRKLDERRKQEDNAKTETDISKKQQRLAALQADTAGGHAVEIAQLQKEIAEAQQNYQRSLEDQLIEKLQNQGDEAERQRQRQIELLEAQKEIADQTGTNLEQVKQWLQNPQANYEAIRSAWLTNQGYEDATPNGRKQLEQQFEVEFAKYQGYSAQLKQYQQMVGSLTSLETNVDKLVNSVATIAYNSAQLHAQKVPAKTLFNAGWSADVLAKGGYSTKDIVEAGYKESQLRAAGITPTTVKNYNKQNPKNPISLASFKKAGFDSSEASEAGYTPTAIKKVYGTTNKSTTKKSTTTTSTKITAAQKANAQKAYKAFLTSHGSKKGKYKGQLTAQQLKTQLSNGKIGYNYAEMPMLQALANTDALTWVHVLKAYKNLKGKKIAAENVKKYFGSNPSSARAKGWKAAFGKTYPKYATGGLADSTGPAWLDGTPSKPELVLNAKDTQNFIALKDVLAKAMNSMGDTSNTYGDIMYEININVDKIEKDYDVDRVVEKVKKEITKGAGYRNVTQVRNFR